MVTGTMSAVPAQRALESRRAEVWGRVQRNELSFEKAMGEMTDWEVKVGDRRFLLHPPTGEWLVYDELHDDFVSLGIRVDGDLRSVPGDVAAVCPQCGMRSKSGDRFCAACGTSVEQVDRLCTHCGAHLSPGDAFCVSCGRATGPVKAKRRPSTRGVLRAALVVAGLTLTGIGVARAVSSDLPPGPLVAEVITPSTLASVADPVQPIASTTAPVSTLAPEPDVTIPPEGAVTPPVSTTTSCDNDVIGFTIEYPAGWHVAGTDADGPCVFFNPEPIDLVEASEAPVAIAVYWADLPFSDVVASYESEGVIIGQRESTQVAGSRALRILYTFTDDGFEPGASGYDIVVRHRGGALVLTTFEPFSRDFTTTRSVVDSMAASLEFRSDE